VAKSSLATLTILLAAPTAPATAQAPVPLSAEDAARLDRAMHDRHARGCDDPAINQIVVCGRSLAGHGQRMEFEREPGEIVRHINEPGSGVAALAAGGCTRLCDVGVRVDLIAAARAVPKIVRHILGHD
jgi:hypothetical protein